MACHLLHVSGYSSVFLANSAASASEDVEYPLSCFKVYNKDYPLQPRHWLNIRRECCILSRLQEERVDGVVQLLSVANTAHHFSLQFKACLGGNLYQALQRRECCEERDLCVKVVIPLLRVLNSLHSRGIIHRDIKPENIFFEHDSKLVLGDFGLAIDSSQHNPCSRVGTPDYMAPEVFAQPSADVVALGQVSSSSIMPYSTAVDIWAVGTLVCEALTGMVPFYHPDPTLMALKMQYGRPHPLPLGASLACQAFVDATLQKTASKRPTAAELLGHPWIQQHADAAAAMVATRVKDKVLTELQMDRPSIGSATQPPASSTLPAAAGNISSVMQGTPATPLGSCPKPHVLQADSTKSAGQAVGAVCSSFGCGRKKDRSSSVIPPCSHNKQAWARPSSAGTPQAPLWRKVATQQPGAWSLQEMKCRKDAIVKQHMRKPQGAGHLCTQPTAQAAGAASMSTGQSPPQQNNGHTPQSIPAGASNARCCKGLCAQTVAASFNKAVQPVDTQSSWSAPVVVATSAASTALQPTGCCKSRCCSSTTAQHSPKSRPCSAPVSRVGSGCDQTVQPPPQQPVDLQHHVLCCTTRAVQCIDQPGIKAAPEHSSTQDITTTRLSASSDTGKLSLSSCQTRSRVLAGGSNRHPFKGVPARVGFFAKQGYTVPVQHKPPLQDPGMQVSVQPGGLTVTDPRLPLPSPCKPGMLMQKLLRLGKQCIAPGACSTTTAARHSCGVSGRDAQRTAGITAAVEPNSSNVLPALGLPMDKPQPASYAMHDTPAQTAPLAMSIGDAPPWAALKKLTGLVSPSIACQAAAAVVTSSMGHKRIGCPCDSSHVNSERQASKAPEGLKPCASCCLKDPHTAPLPLTLTAPVLGAEQSPTLQCFCPGRQAASSVDTSAGHTGKSAKGTHLKVLQHFLRRLQQIDTPPASRT